MLEAMKAKDKDRLSIIRLAINEIKALEKSSQSETESSVDHPSKNGQKR